MDDDAAWSAWDVSMWPTHYLVERDRNAPPDAPRALTGRGPVQGAIAATLLALVLGTLLLKFLVGREPEVAITKREFREFPLAEKEQISHNTILLRFKLPKRNQRLGLGLGKHLSVMAEDDDGEELVRRLVGRGTETEEQRERRLVTAREELAAEPEFDVTIVNHEVRAAADDLVTLMMLDPEAAVPAPRGSTSLSNDS